MLLPFEAIKCGRSERQQQDDQRERRRKMLQVMRCALGRVVNKMRGDRQDRAASQRQGPERFSQAELSRFHVSSLEHGPNVSIFGLLKWRTYDTCSLMKSRTGLTALCVLLLLIALPSLATRFIPLSIEELAAAADLIVQGTVQSRTCARDAEGRIFTRVELAASETWKGKASAKVSVVQSGGVLGEEAATVPGQADYDVGEEVVAFLALNARGEPVTLSLAQGKFHVWKDGKTGEKFARNIFHGGGGEFDARGAAARLTVAELKRRALQGKQ